MWWSFFSSVIWKIRLPSSPSSGTRSKRRENARWKTLGSRWAKPGFSVMMRTSVELKV